MVAAAVLIGAARSARPQDGDGATALAQRLVRAYPDLLDRVENHEIVWRDGTRMPLGIIARRPEAETIAAPSLADIFRWPYPAGAKALSPPPDHDPGRARPRALFDRMYGDCTKGAVAANLVDVVWLPTRWGRTLKATRINGVAERLAAVSRELDRLPRSFDRFLVPPAGTYHCRPIAGTDRMSAHGWGIAIDLAAGPAHYWRWDRPGAGPAPAWRNRLPEAIVAVFERHGFIWGGRWHHYDTMHFEYRPELTASEP